MNPNKQAAKRVRLSRRHQAWLYLSFSVLLASGLLWLGFHYFGEAHTAIGAAPHPSEVWWLRIHGFAAMLGLIVFGSMLTVHIPTAWDMRKSRISGGCMVVALVLLAATGYGLYYMASEQLHPWMSAIHWLLGLALVPVALVHVLYRRESAAIAQPSQHEHASAQVQPQPRKTAHAGGKTPGARHRP